MRYVVTEHEFSNSELGCYRTKGIAAMEGEKGDALLDEVQDVSTVAEVAERIAAVLNENEVSLPHFREVLGDLVAEL